MLKPPKKKYKGIELRLGSGQNLAVSKKDLRNNEPSYVKYSAFRSEGSVSLDPLEPSKFRHKKVRAILFLCISFIVLLQVPKAPIQLSLRPYIIALSEKRAAVFRRMDHTSFNFKLEGRMFLFCICLF